MNVTSICMDLICSYPQYKNHAYAISFPFHQTPRSKQVPAIKLVSSHSAILSPKCPSPQTTSSSPKNPATAPSRFPATFLPTAPDFGAAVLLVLGAGAVDELVSAAAEELEEEAADGLEVVEVVSVPEVVEVTIPSDAEVTLATIGVGVTKVGVTKDAVSVMIALGTEAVEAKPSVATEAAPLAAEDAPAPALEAAWEAVASAL